MTEISITIPGEPVAKATVKRGKNGMAYKAKKTAAYMKEIAQLAIVAMIGKKLITGPVCLRWTAYFEIPASWPQWKRNAALDGSLRHTSKPDYTNLAKMEDALTGIVWLDDSQVVSASVNKEYSRDPRTEIIIFPAAGAPSQIMQRHYLDIGVKVRTVKA